MLAGLSEDGTFQNPTLLLGERRSGERLAQRAASAAAARRCEAFLPHLSLISSSADDRGYLSSQTSSKRQPL